MKIDSILIILSTLFLFSCENKILYQEKQILLGTVVEVTSPAKEAARIVFEEIKRIEGLLSKYKEDSEIANINRLKRVKVSPETFFVIEKAKWFWQKTEGAFDVTVEPLLELWGFRDKNFRVPAEKEILETLNYIGSDKIILYSSERIVELKLPGMKIDLGAIAKGYAVDCAVKKLKENNITSCLINAGGDIFALGDKFGKPWRIGIKEPRMESVAGYLELKNKAVATSGDYEQYFVDKEGNRFSHIIDPRKGYPVRVSFSSVTVIADNCLTADALATAFFVLGEEKTKEILNRFPGVEIKFVR